MAVRPEAEVDEIERLGQGAGLLGGGSVEIG